MKIILLKDVPKIGKKWEVKNVSAGFARNYLVPRGLAEIATDSKIKDLGAQKKEDVEKAEEELAYVQDLASKLDGLEIEIKVKSGDSGDLYSAVSAELIAKTLNDMNYMVEKKQIKIESPIKQLGEHQVSLVFKHGLEAELKLVLIQEEPLKK